MGEVDAVLEKIRLDIQLTPDDEAILAIEIERLRAAALFCIADGTSREEVLRRLRAALQGEEVEGG